MKAPKLFVDGKFLGDVESMNHTVQDWPIPPRYRESDPRPTIEITLKRRGPRRRLLRVSPDLMVGLCSGTYRVIANPLPADAEIVERSYDHCRGLFSIVVEHESFDETDPDEPLPEVPGPMVERVVNFDKMDRVANAAAVLASEPYTYGRGLVRAHSPSVAADWDGLREALFDAGYLMNLSTAT